MWQGVVADHLKSFKKSFWEFMKKKNWQMYTHTLDI